MWNYLPKKAVEILFFGTPWTVKNIKECTIAKEWTSK